MSNFSHSTNKNHSRYPSSPYVQIKANETYSLQMAIYLTFNEWLDKRMTLANWGCEIDLTLNTIITQNKFMHKKDEIIEDEEKYRRLMTITSGKLAADSSSSCRHSFCYLG